MSKVSVAEAFLALLDDVREDRQRPVEEYVAHVAPQHEATLRELIAGYFASSRQRHLNEASYQRVLSALDGLSVSSPADQEEA